MEIHVYQVAKLLDRAAENDSIRSYAGHGSFYAADVLRRVAAGMFGMNRHACVDVQFVRTVDTETTRLTKWELISDRERRLLDAQEFTGSDGKAGRCSACGEDIGTEGKFARHFTVTDYRYANVGECPNKVKDDEWCKCDPKVGIYNHPAEGVCEGSV